MELEGFGASLVGRPIFVYADAEHAWIPFEFISGVTYNARILVTGHACSPVELEYPWNIVFRPSQPKDWSALATILRGLGKTLLLVFDHPATDPPDSFYPFLESMLAEGRTVITRVWIGTAVALPLIPDAVFFPPQADAAAAAELVQALPERAGRHGPCKIQAAEWASPAKATQDMKLGIIVSDVGESEWTVFWHKPADSRCESSAAITKRMIQWIRNATRMIETYQTE